MSDESLKSRRSANAGSAALAGLLPVAILGWHLGSALATRAVLLPVGVFLFTFAVALWLLPRLGRPRAVALAAFTGILGGHLTLWLPFLTVSYVGAQGAGRLDYSVSASLFTAAAVAWYVLGDYLPETLALCAAIIGLLVFFRRRPAIQRGDK